MFRIQDKLDRQQFRSFQMFLEVHGIPESSLSPTSGIKSQLITFAALTTPSTSDQEHYMFPHLLRANYHQITLAH